MDDIGAALQAVLTRGSRIKRKPKTWLVEEDGTRFRVGVRTTTTGATLKVRVDTPWWVWILIISPIIFLIVAYVYEAAKANEARRLMGRLVATLGGPAVANARPVTKPAPSAARTSAKAPSPPGRPTAGQRSSTVPAARPPGNLPPRR